MQQEDLEKQFLLLIMVLGVKLTFQRTMRKKKKKKNQETNFDTSLNGI